MADRGELLATATRLFAHAAQAMEMAQRNQSAGLAILAEIGAGRGDNSAASDLVRVGHLLATCKERRLRLSGDQHVSEKDAADLIGVARTTLATWRMEGQVPYRRLPGGGIQYAISNLSLFIGTFSKD